MKIIRRGLLLILLLASMVLLGVAFDHMETDREVETNNGQATAEAELAEEISNDTSEAASADTIEEPVVFNGWIEEEGGFCYYENGEKLKGKQKIDGEILFFDDNTGVLIESSGFISSMGKTYYRNKKGELLSGFRTIKGKKYYFNRDGEMLCGFRTIKKEIYYFNSKGQMLTGLRNIDGEKYYFDESGVMQTGFHEIDDNTYYFKKDGKAIKSGLYKIKGNACTFNDKGQLIRTVYKDKPAVCLTYDDGPSKYTAGLLEVLKDNDGLATFFVVGNRIKSYKDSFKAVVDSGCQIGNHSWSHKYYNQLEESDIKEQIERTNKAAEKLGYEITVARTPGGFTSEEINSAVGMPIILWSLDTLDWKTRNADSTYNAIIGRVKDGDIILMHDLYEATYEASERFIPKLKEMGYQLVTIDEMAIIKDKKLESEKVYSAMR